MEEGESSAIGSWEGRIDKQGSIFDFNSSQFQSAQSVSPYFNRITVVQCFGAQGGHELELLGPWVLYSGVRVGKSQKHNPNQVFAISLVTALTEQPHSASHPNVLNGSREPGIACKNRTFVYIRFIHPTFLSTNNVVRRQRIETVWNVIFYTVLTGTTSVRHSIISVYEQFKLSK